MRSDSVFCSFSSTMRRISSSFLLLSSCIARRFLSTVARMFSRFCVVSAVKPCRRFSNWPSWSVTLPILPVRLLSMSASCWRWASRPCFRFWLTSVPSAENAPPRSLLSARGAAAGLRVSSTITSTSSTTTSARVISGMYCIGLSPSFYSTCSSLAMRCISSSVAAITSAHALRSSEICGGTSTSAL